MHSIVGFTSTCFITMDSWLVSLLFASFESVSARAFSTRGIWLISTISKPLINYVALWKYWRMWSSFIWNVLLICSTTSCESVLHSTRRAATSLTTARPATKASYSVWLFETLNFKNNEWLITILFSPYKTLLAHHPFLSKDPSFLATSTKNLVRCCSWMEPCGLKCKPNSDNSIN